MRIILNIVYLAYFLELDVEGILEYTWNPIKWTVYPFIDDLDSDTGYTSTVFADYDEGLDQAFWTIMDHVTEPNLGYCIIYSSIRENKDGIIQ